ncbi:MAG: hypothetical protein M3N33_05700, partial [Actinomycetota bacterium]|nr:hypothetical protein [Actinomycetota bacterium]
MDRQPGERRPRDGGRGVGARVSFGLSWFICLLCVALGVVSLLLGLLNGRTLGEFFVEENIVSIFALTVAFSGVGALVASHRPGNSIGWIFCAAALCQVLAAFGDEYATYALITRPGSLPLGAEMSWLTEWIWAPGLGLILVFLPLLFPDGRPPSRRWRPVAWLGGFSIAMIVVLASILLWSERGTRLLGDTGIADRGPGWLVALLSAAFPLMLLAGLAAVTSLFARFHRSRGEERQQVKWFAYAAALSLFWVFLLDGIPDPGRVFETVITVLGLFVIPSIPLAAGIAIFRYHLYDIDRIINRTLVYGALTAMLVTLYLGGVVTTQTVVRLLTGQEQQPQLAVVASTLVIAALFSPLRRRIQAIVDRRFYRSKYDAAKTLEAFGARLREETELGHLEGDLV